MNPLAFPSRQGLIRGAVLVALHGLEQEYLTVARLRGDEEGAPDDEVRAVRAIARAVREFGVAHTGRRDVRKLLSCTRQMLCVSPEEWESVCPVRIANRSTATMANA